MSKVPLILVADDEESILANLSFAMEKEGWKVVTAPEGSTAWKLFQERNPDLVLLDISMPLEDGIEVLRKIRTVNEILPVMFLTSRDEEFDKVFGLSSGADDYLCKPFSLRELVARIKVLLRRSQNNKPRTSEIALGDLKLSSDRLEAQWMTTPLKLTLTEFRILENLIKQPGVIKSRLQLIQAAYPEDIYVTDRSVDTHIKRIRKKILDAGGLDVIQTLYGTGYKAVPPSL